MKYLIVREWIAGNWIYRAHRNFFGIINGLTCVAGTASDTMSGCEEHLNRRLESKKREHIKTIVKELEIK